MTCCSITKKNQFFANLNFPWTTNPLPMIELSQIFCLRLQSRLFCTLTNRSTYGPLNFVCLSFEYKHMYCNMRAAWRYYWQMYCIILCIFPSIASYPIAADIHQQLKQMNNKLQNQITRMKMPKCKPVPCSLA